MKSLPQIVEKEIANSVQFYNSGMSSYKHELFTGVSVQTAMKRWDEQAKCDERLIDTLYTYGENVDLLYDEDSLAIIDALLKAPQDRLAVIHDGSYYANRIWAHVNSKTEKVSFSPEISWATPALKQAADVLDAKPAKEKVKYMLSKFRRVYVQICLVETREDIERHISDEIEFDNSLNKFSW